MNISDLSAAQLRRAAALKERIENLHKELTRVLGTAPPAAVAPNGRRKKRRMSAAARRKLSAFQKARWAKLKKAQKPAQPPQKKRKMSAAGRAAISRAAKARWAKIKAAQQKQ
jgi:hypothetical protein